MTHKRQFIVRSDNITISYQRLGTKVVEAQTGPELLERICRIYEFPWPMLPGHEIQLWSGQLGTIGRVRVDKFEQIPFGIQDIWIYASGSVGRGF